MKSNIKRWMLLLPFVKKPAIQNVFAGLLKNKSDVINGFKCTNPKPNRRWWDDFHDLYFEKFKSFTKKFVKKTLKRETRSLIFDHRKISIQCMSSVLLKYASHEKCTRLLKNKSIAIGEITYDNTNTKLRL